MDTNRLTTLDTTVSLGNATLPLAHDSTFLASLGTGANNAALDVLQPLEELDNKGVAAPSHP